jgi:hypothetical protein
MLRNIALATVTVVSLALVAYSTPAVPTVLAAGVQLKTGLSDLVGVTDSVLVKEGGEGKGGKGARATLKAVGMAMAVAGDTPKAVGTTMAVAEVR